MKPPIVFYLAVFALVFNSCEKKVDTIAGPGRESLSDPSIKPAVISTVPANGGSGPFKVFDQGDGSGNSHFVIQFNKYIDIASIRQSTVTITGFDEPVDVSLYSQSYYYYGNSRPDKTRKSEQSSGIEGRNEVKSPYQDLLEFRVRSRSNGNSMRYELGKTYVVTIDTSLEDINGNRLQSRYSFSFKPEPQFRVVGTWPLNNSSDINIDYRPQISVTFNTAVTSTILTKLHLTPTVGGTWSLNAPYDSTFVVFMPSGDYSFKTLYDIMVDAGGQDARGNSLSSQYRSRFTTQAFEVISSSPRDREFLYMLNSQLSFDLSGRYDTSTVRSAFSLSPSVGGNLNYYYDGRYINFYPTTGFRAARSYVATLSTSLKTKNGQSMDQPYLVHFQADSFRVRYASLSSGDSSVYRSRSITFETNSLVDPTSLSSLMVEPTTVVNKYNSGTSITVYATWLANTNYTITAARSLRSIAGDSLCAPYVLKFKTGLY